MIQFWTTKLRDTLFMQSGMEKETDKHMDTNEQRKASCCYDVAQSNARIHKTQFSK